MNHGVTTLMKKTSRDVTHLESAHFIKLKSPNGVHYFQYHEVIIWFSSNTVGQKLSKVFMFLDFTQLNNQKKLR